jgi:hypothetical protein
MPMTSAAWLAAAEGHRLGGGELLVRQLALQVQLRQLAELGRGRRRAGVLRPRYLHQRLVLLTFASCAQQRLVLLTFATGSQQRLVLPAFGTGSQQRLVLPTFGTGPQQRLVLPTFGTGPQQRLALLAFDWADALTLIALGAGLLGGPATHRPACGEGAAHGRGAQQWPAPDEPWSAVHPAVLPPGLR